VWKDLKKFLGAEEERTVKRPINAPVIVIHPGSNIAHALNIGRRTVTSWVKWHGFPVFHLPDGQVATTVGMIERWAEERRQKELAEPTNGQRKRLSHPARSYRVKMKKAG